jgi:hypothetical protein
LLWGLNWKTQEVLKNSALYIANILWVLVKIVLTIGKTIDLFFFLSSLHYTNINLWKNIVPLSQDLSFLLCTINLLNSSFRCEMKRPPFTLSINILFKRGISLTTFYYTIYAYGGPILMKCDIFEGKYHVHEKKEI